MTTQKLNIKNIGPKDFELWDQFVYSTNSGTIFHTSRWGQVISNLVGRPFQIWAAFEDENICGGILFWSKKNLNIISIPSVPATPYQGILTRTIKSKRSSSVISDQHKITSALINVIKKEYQFISIPLSLGISDTRPYQWEDFEVSPVYTYTFDIKPIEELEFQFNRTLRQNIRTAKKDGFYIESSTDVNPLTDFITISYKQHGKLPPISKHKLGPFFNDILKKELGKVFYLKQNNETIAGLLALNDSKSVYALFMGIDKQHRNQNQNKYIYASIMEMEEFQGKSFDFLGANEKDFETLKRSFGGKLETIYRVNYYRNIWIKVLANLRTRQHLFQRKNSGRI